MLPTIERLLNALASTTSRIFHRELVEPPDSKGHVSDL